MTEVEENGGSSGFSSFTSQAEADIREFQSRYEEQNLQIGPRDWRIRDTRSPGPILAFLPGAQGTGDVFGRTALKLAGGVRVLALTPPAEPEPIQLADQIASVMDALGLRRMSLYGSSIGGYVAQVFAHHHPGRVQTLFLGSTFCDPTISQAKFPPLDQFHDLPAETLMKDMLARARRTPKDDEDAAALKSVLRAQMGSRQDADTLKARLLTILLGEPLGKAPVPDGDVVVVDADDDPQVSVEQRVQMRTLYHRSTHAHVAGGGHYPFLLRPTETSAVIIAHLSAI